MADFGEILKVERERQGISQRQLARMIGCTGRAIGYWEEGKRIRSIVMGDRALKVLGVEFKIGEDRKQQ